jgi:hypothetical protein
MGLRRQFAENILERLALISLGRHAGFSLHEIARVFASDGRTRIDRRMLAGKAEELGASIRKMTALREGLLHAAACPAVSHLECPTFRRLLKISMPVKVRSSKRKRTLPA